MFACRVQKRARGEKTHINQSAVRNALENMLLKKSTWVEGQRITTSVDLEKRSAKGTATTSGKGKSFGGGGKHQSWAERRIARATVAGPRPKPRGRVGGGTI